MPITKKELKEIKDALDASARPLFLFDDDCDGTTSFVQLYKYKKEGKGVPVKASPVVDEKYVRKVEEYQPDLVFIVDKPVVKPEFFDKVKTPIIWLDHHKPMDVKRWSNVKCYNPRIHDDEDNLPATYWCYKVTGGPLWLATVGAVADWHVPDYIKEFEKEYKDLLPPKYKKVEDLLFNPKSGVGKLARIISFNLKGTVQETMKSVLVLTRIETPYEILNQTTPRGKYLYKKYKRLADKYHALLERAKAAFDENEKVLIFTYEDDQMSLTSDLSNELLYLFPEQLIMIARRHNGEYKYSLRSAGKYEIPLLLEKALKGVEGYGGGHTYACGGCVAEKDDEKFVKAIKRLLK
ncbi:DHH family phosphoesterase [Candidatus Woesearchaeota archaeon]|nr:DHH family phosphoesterase [Candidatus Woesearchaeota archaeon]